MAHLARMMRTPSTRLVDMGTWELSDIAKAEKTLETEELMSPALRDKATWQMLLSSAVAFTAAMGWGRAVTVMLDSDDVIDGNYNADQPIEIDWRVIPTIFYTFVVMFVVFLVMHRLHRYRDRKERRYQRWAARMDRQEQALQKAAAHGGEEADGAAQQQHQLEAERVVRWMEVQFLSQVVTNFTGGWTYSSMFMWTVLLHSFLDHERADLSATCWLLLVLHVVCTSLAVAAYEAPLRSAERLGISVDRDRLDTVAGAFTGTLAWLLAIHWMEFSEVLAAHFMDLQGEAIRLATLSSRMERDGVGQLFELQTDFEVVEEGQWTEFLLYDDGEWFDHRCELVPTICQVMSSLAAVAGTIEGFEAAAPGQVTILRMAGGTRLRPHCGPHPPTDPPVIPPSHPRPVP